MVRKSLRPPFKGLTACDCGAQTARHDVSEIQRKFRHLRSAFSARYWVAMWGYALRTERPARAVATTVHRHHATRQVH